MRNIITLIILMSGMNSVAMQQTPEGGKSTFAQLESNHILKEVQQLLLTRLKENQELTPGDRETIALIKSLELQVTPSSGLPSVMSASTVSSSRTPLDLLHLLNASGDIASILGYLRRCAPCL